jgi:F-type H+-transporting ATPase subunit b
VVINLNWTMGLQFVNFVILMILLNYLLFRPVRRILAERRETIDSSHKQARELEGRIEEKMARYQSQLQDAKNKGHRERGTLRNQAQQEEAKILEAARGEAGDYMRSIKNQVAAEANQARQLLHAEARGLANTIAAKVLGRAV